MIKINKKKRGSFALPLDSRVKHREILNSSICRKQGEVERREEKCRYCLFHMVHLSDLLLSRPMIVSCSYRMLTFFSFSLSLSHFLYYRHSRLLYRLGGFFLLPSLICYCCTERKNSGTRHHHHPSQNFLLRLLFFILAGLFFKDDDVDDDEKEGTKMHFYISLYIWIRERYAQNKDAEEKEKGRREIII